MVDYEKRAYEDVQAWLRKLEKPPSLTQTFTKNVQHKFNQYVPEKVHGALGKAVQQMVSGVINGSEYLRDGKYEKARSLKEADEKLEEIVPAFQKGAAAEGAGTGAGGILLGAADFPLLLGFKMRFLFSSAAIYGLDLHDFRNRLYMLYLFQAAFSSPVKRQETARILKHWEEHIADKPRKFSMAKEMDWAAFQQEYRDHIDLVKLMQIIPGFGAFVGAAANYHFLTQLRETAKQGYRWKWLNSKSCPR